MALDESRLAREESSASNGRASEGGSGSRRARGTYPEDSERDGRGRGVFRVRRGAVAQARAARASRGTRREVHGSTRPRLKQQLHGRPDLSGTWRRTNRDPVPAVLAGLFVNQTAGRNGRGAPPPPSVTEPGKQPGSDANSPPVAAFWDIGTNLKDGVLPLSPWAAEIQETAQRDEQRQQSGRELLALGHSPAPHAPRPAEGHSNA